MEPSPGATAAAASTRATRSRTATRRARMVAGGLSDRSWRWGSTCSRATGARRRGWPARRSTAASHRRPLAAPRSGSCCSCWATVMDGRFRAVECRGAPTRSFAGPNAKGRRSAATRRSSRCSCAAGGSWGSGSPMARRSRATPSSARSAPGCSRACCLPAHYPAGSTGGFGSGAFGAAHVKLDHALSGPVPWTAAEPRLSAVVDMGVSSGDLARAAQQARRGELPVPSRPRRRPAVAARPITRPARPAEVSTCMATCRCTTRTPTKPSRTVSRNNSSASRPGSARSSSPTRSAPPWQTKQENPSLVGGDLGGGSYELDQQLIFRPSLALCRYRSPLRGLYVAGASTHPGGAVHGGTERPAPSCAIGGCGARCRAPSAPVGRQMPSFPGR